MNQSLRGVYLQVENLSLGSREAKEVGALAHSLSHVPTKRAFACGGLAPKENDPISRDIGID
jgi:hypothetical protein